MSLEELRNLIIKYELALQAMEEAHEQAVGNENCGMGCKYLTDQEQAEAFACKIAEEVRWEAKKLGIELPGVVPFEYIRVVRPGYVDRPSKFSTKTKVEEVNESVKKLLDLEDM